MVDEKDNVAVLVYEFDRNGNPINLPASFKGQKNMCRNDNAYIKECSGAEDHYLNLLKQVRSMRQSRKPILSIVRI